MRPGLDLAVESALDVGAVSSLVRRRDARAEAGTDSAVDVEGARGAGIAAVLVDPADLFPGVDCPRIRRLPDLLDLLPPVAGGPSGLG